MDIMRLSACLVVNQITVDSYSFLFNCMTSGQASDLNDGPDVKFYPDACHWLGPL